MPLTDAEWNVAVNRHYSYLCVVARNGVGLAFRARFDPVDLVQETLLQAISNRDRFNGDRGDELKSWLSAILRHRLADWVRRNLRKNRNVHVERSLEDALQHTSRCLERWGAGKQSTPSQKAIRRETALLVADALNELAPEHRDVVELTEIQGLTQAQVASYLGCDQSSVSRLYGKALAELRRRLKELE